MSDWRGSIKFKTKLMTKLLLAAVAAVIVFHAAATAICGQNDSDVSRAKAENRPRNELEVLGGGTFSSKKVIGNAIPDSVVAFAGLRYARRIYSSKHIGLKYTADVFPLMILSYPEAVAGPGAAVIERRRTVAGVSVSLPGGLRTTFLPRAKYQPFIDLGTGIAYFTKRIPRVGGTRFNYTASVGAGVQVRIADGRHVSLGYRFHHISNGGRGETNPSFNTHDLFVGYSFKSW